MGGLASLVLCEEVVDYVGLELPLQVEDVVGDIEDLADAPGVLHVVQSAAALVVGGGVYVGVVEKLHGDADDLIAGLLEEEGGNGGVDAAAHGDDYLRRCV